MNEFLKLQYGKRRSFISIYNQLTITKKPDLFFPAVIAENLSKNKQRIV